MMQVTGVHLSLHCALMALTYVATAELRKAHLVRSRLDSCDVDGSAGRMKMRDPHIVPLSKQASCC